jgi:hypothetical protein
MADPSTLFGRQRGEQTLLVLNAIALY